MKKLIIAFALLISFSSQADQLAYLSKADAYRAVEMINKMSYVYLFCGCCSIIEPVKVKVINAYCLHTGYEDYYEVSIVYEETGKGGDKVTTIDLAYVWKKKLFGYKTIGKLLKLEHDHCVQLNDWSNPKHVEKDI